jgi:hypothetical protein
LEREVRRSGSVTYSAADGHRDDPVAAIALAVFGCRRFACPEHPAAGQLTNAHRGGDVMPSEKQEVGYLPLR